MNAKTILLAGTILTAALAARADGTITWAWSCSFEVGPGLSYGSGTFTSDATETTSGGNTGYLVTDITGVANSAPITGLGGIGDFSFYAPSDNLLIPTSATTATVDAGGVAFHIQGGGEQAFLNISGTTYVTGAGIPATLSITEVSESVPEPGVAALAAVGGLGLLGFRRKK